MYLTPDAVTHSELTRTQIPSRNFCPLPFWKQELTLTQSPDPNDCVCVCVFMSLGVVMCIGGAVREKTSALLSLWGCWEYCDLWRPLNVFPNSRYVSVKHVWLEPGWLCWRHVFSNSRYALLKITHAFFCKYFHVGSSEHELHWAKMILLKCTSFIEWVTTFLLFSYLIHRLCLTALWTLWRMCSTSWLSTYSSCSSLPWLPCNSSRDASFTALMNLKNLSVTAGQEIPQLCRSSVVKMSCSICLFCPFIHIVCPIVSLILPFIPRLTQTQKQKILLWYFVFQGRVSGVWAG